MSGLLKEADFVFEGSARVLHFFGFDQDPGLDDLDFKIRQTSEGGELFDYDERSNTIYVDSIVEKRLGNTHFENYMMKEAVETIAYDICDINEDGLGDPVVTAMASSYAGSEVLVSNTPLNDIAESLEPKLKSFQSTYFEENVYDMAQIKASEERNFQSLTSIEDPVDEAWMYLAAASRDLHSTLAYED